MGKGKPQSTSERINQQKKIKTKIVPVIHSPKQLMKKYKKTIEDYLDQFSQAKKKQKATNIPKFLINIFMRNLPDFQDEQHNNRLRQFNQQNQKSMTRFDLVQLFGLNQDQVINCQNARNRNAMIRLLNKNYINVLTNQHISNKKAYLLYCKKIMLRLRQPSTIDRLQV